MTDQEIKTAPSLKLKSNPYLVDPEVAFPYQRRMILMMLKRPRMIDGDDVGLGKTACAIFNYTYLKAADSKTKAIVFTERAAFRQWENEFARWTKNLTVKLINTDTHPDRGRRISAMRQFSGDVLISSYSLIYNYRQYLTEGLLPRFVVYADEPNYFKNTSSALHKSMLEFSYQASRFYGLTATILENRLEEAYGITRVVAPGVMGTKSDFEKKYCIRKKLRGKRIWVTVGYHNLDQFRKEIEPVFYGRLQTDPEVKQKLPEEIHKDVEVVMTREQSQKVLEATERLIELPSGIVKQVEVLPALILAQQLTNDPRLLGFDLRSAKAEGLTEMLENSLDGERVIIYSKFRSQIDLLESDFKKKGRDLVRITGKEEDDVRVTAQRRFMSDGKDRCNILLMTRAGLKAINLQQGAIIIAYDLPWSYGHYRQLVGRIKRTGSKYASVVIYRMLGVLHPEIAALAGGEKTIDHHTLSVLTRKKDLFNVVTGDVTSMETSYADVTLIYQQIKAGRQKVK